MRALWVGVVVALAACGGAQVATPAWQKPYSGYWNGNAPSSEPFRNGDDAPVYLGLHFADDMDLTVEAIEPTTHEVLARFEHATQQRYFEPGYMALETRDPHSKQTSWRIASFKREGERTTLASFSPALIDFARWDSKPYQAASVFAIAAGTEPGLYLPLGLLGRPVWFPPGVIGAKPILFKAYTGDMWKGWLVKWTAPRPGWSLSFDEHLVDLPPGGPTWTDVHVDIVSTKYGDWQVVYGTNFDGTCEATGAAPDQGWKRSPLTSGPTCEAALAGSIAKYDVMVADEDKRIAKVVADEEAQTASEAAERAQFERDENSYEDAMTVTFEGGWKRKVAFTPAACQFARSIPSERHLAVLRHRTYSRVDSTELRCFVEREDVNAGQKIEATEATEAGNRIVAAEAQADEIRAEQARLRRQDSEAAARRPAPGAPDYDDHGVGANTRALEKQIQAEEAYTHGAGGVCPFTDRSYCN